ncbi:hypothetical protein ACSS6W_007077 [Trichoderma asperelloides]
MSMLDSSPRSSSPTAGPTMTDIVPRRAWPDMPDLRRTPSVLYSETVVKTPAYAEDETNIPLSHYETVGVQKPRDVSLHGVDRLVQDLLATRTLIEEEKRKVIEKDAEIARMGEQISRIIDKAHTQLLDKTNEHGPTSNTTETKAQHLERIKVLQPAPDEEISKLGRLLDFHKTNGERVSRQCQELQAINKELQASLQAAEKALEEQVALISSLGLQPHCRHS